MMAPVCLSQVLKCLFLIVILVLHYSFSSTDDVDKNILCMFRVLLGILCVMYIM